MSFQRATHLGHANHNHPLFTAQVCRSSDEGRTWSEARLAANYPLGGVMDRGVHILPDGSIFMHYRCTYLAPMPGSGVHGLEWTVRFGKPF